MRESCAAALDGCILLELTHLLHAVWCSSYHEVDPNNGYAISSVGDDLGDKQEKYVGTIAGI